MVLAQQLVLCRRPTHDDGRLLLYAKTPSSVRGMNCLHKLLGRRKVCANEHVVVQLPHDDSSCGPTDYGSFAPVVYLRVP